jgi:hypothetical protein
MRSLQELQKVPFAKMTTEEECLFVPPVTSRFAQTMNEVCNNEVCHEEDHEAYMQFLSLEMSQL